MGWTDNVADYEPAEQACLRCRESFMGVFAGMCADCRSVLNRAAARDAAKRSLDTDHEATEPDRLQLAGQERAVR